jgi:hypothetical protein
MMKPGAVEVPVVAEGMHQEASSDSWLLECIYSAALEPEDLWAVPLSLRNLALPLTSESGPKVLGRTHQNQMFEALLGNEPTLLACISRNHVQLEVAKRNHTTVSIDTVPEDEMQAIVVTNMSSNVIVSNRASSQSPMTTLYQNDSAELNNGDTLSFACEQHLAAPEEGAASATPQKARQGGEIGTTKIDLDSQSSNVAIVPFLTLRITAPPAPAPPSPFVMLSPPSAYSVEPQQPEVDTPVAEEGNSAPPHIAPPQVVSLTQQIANDRSPKFVATPTRKSPSPPKAAAAANTVPAVNNPTAKAKKDGSGKQDCAMQ